MQSEVANAAWYSGPISRDAAIISLRYPNIARCCLREVRAAPPKWCDPPPWHLVSHRRIFAIPHFATYCAIMVRYPIKTSAKEFCDTIATSIARYEKYRCCSSRSIAAWYRYFVQIASDNVGVYLHFLVGSAGLKPTYIKSARDLTVSSSLMGLLAKVCCKKNCRNSPESVRISAEIRFNVSGTSVNQTCFCNDPFPNDPISELLTLMISSKSTWECMWHGWSMIGKT